MYKLGGILSIESISYMELNCSFFKDILISGSLLSRSLTLPIEIINFTLKLFVFIKMIFYLNNNTFLNILIGLLKSFFIFIK